MCAHVPHTTQQISSQPEVSRTTQLSFEIQAFVRASRLPIHIHFDPALSNRLFGSSASSASKETVSTMRTELMGKWK
eukprot:13406-Eustigmatos_ZCMA.PRE.1